MHPAQQEWHDRANAHHRAEVDKGLHDEKCEWREAGHFLCNCRKRRRIAEGRTVPPRLYWNYPTCTGCWREVSHDGDGYVCEHCHVAWDSRAGDDDQGEWSDDYGDLDPTPWDRP